MSDFLEYKGYMGTVEYSKSDDCLFGKILGVRDLILYEGQSVTELKKDFENSIDDYISLCKEKNKMPEEAFKGSFNVRIGSELHRDVFMKAYRENMSLNAYVKKCLQQAVNQ